MEREWVYCGRGLWTYRIEAGGYVYRVELQKTNVDYWARLGGVTGSIHFELATLDAAKAEALRLVREAVKRLAEAVGE